MSKTFALVSERCQDNQNICMEINVSMGPEKVLGVPIGKNKQTFWTDKIERLEKRITWWCSRDLSMFGKTYIAKSLIIPMIQFAAAHVHIDDYVIRCVQKLIWKFVWKWKTCFVQNMYVFTQT